MKISVWIENTEEKTTKRRRKNGTVSETVVERYYATKIWLMSDEETQSRPMALRSDPNSLIGAMETDVESMNHESVMTLQNCEPGIKLFKTMTRDEWCGEWTVTACHTMLKKI